MSMSSVRRAVLLTLCVALFLPVVAHGAEPTDQDRAKAESLYKVALIAIDQRDWSMAEAKLKDILVMFPDQPKANLRMAQVKSELLKPTQAKAYLDKARRGDLNDSDRLIADELEPRLEYALAKQADESVNPFVPDVGWKVTKGDFVFFSSYSAFTNLYKKPYRFPANQNGTVLIYVETPGSTGAEQKITWEIVLFDSKNNEIWSEEEQVTKQGDWRSLQAAVNFPLKPIVDANSSTFTLKVRAAGHLLLKLEGSVEQGPVGGEGYEKILGTWKGRWKESSIKFYVTLEISAEQQRPKFVLVEEEKAGDLIHRYYTTKGYLYRVGGGQWDMDFGTRECQNLDSMRLVWECFHFQYVDLSLEPNGELQWEKVSLKRDSR
ncbi:MAG: hypothetical protein ABR961_14410 [Thermoanaerobaculaceae bacterium]|jgi:hypothetical protein